MARFRACLRAWPLQPAILRSLRSSLCITSRRFHFSINMPRVPLRFDFLLIIWWSMPRFRGWCRRYILLFIAFAYSGRSYYCGHAAMIFAAWAFLSLFLRMMAFEHFIYCQGRSRIAFILMAFYMMLLSFKPSRLPFGCQSYFYSGFSYIYW